MGIDPISAGISVVGGLLGNNSAKKEAAKARAYDKEVRQNAHQWEVADLEAAGINKVMTAMHGSGGASTPVANVGNPFKDVQADQSASSARKLQQTQQQIVASEARIQEEREKILTEPTKKFGPPKFMEGSDIPYTKIIKGPSLLEKGLNADLKMKEEQINNGSVDFTSRNLENQFGNYGTYSVKLTVTNDA